LPQGNITDQNRGVVTLKLASAIWEDVMKQRLRRASVFFQAAENKEVRRDEKGEERTSAIQW